MTRILFWLDKKALKENKLYSMIFFLPLSVSYLQVVNLSLCIFSFFRKQNRDFTELGSSWLEVFKINVKQFNFN